MKDITIAYISEASPNDKHAWSGTVHYVYRSLLAEGFNVVPMGPAKPGITRILLAGINKLSLSLFKKRLDYRHSVLYAKAFGRIFNKKLKDTKHQLVVVCGNTECGAYLRTGAPVYYVLDRTIQGALGYHTILSNLWQLSMKQSIYTDRRAMTNARMIFFSSQWAAKHAMSYYSIPENKIMVRPFGANIDEYPGREKVFKPSAPNKWKLLLVGTYWLNKGADIAYAAMCRLRESGLQVSLTVAGCSPPEPITDPDLHIIPFIDKNTAQGYKELSALFLEHHFFILPTRFDCTPIVFCEASAFGLPVISADTGGVRGHIKESVNGFLVPYEDHGNGYAEKIMQLTANFEDYQKLCVSSRILFEEELNWKSWASSFRKTVENDPSIF